MRRPSIPTDPTEREALIGLIFWLAVVAGIVALAWIGVI